MSSTPRLQVPDYLLTLTPEQAEVIASSCLLSARMRAGDLEALATEMEQHGVPSGEGYTDRIKRVRGYMREIAPLLTGKRAEAVQDWGSPDIPQSAREELVVAQAIERALKKEWAGRSSGVSFIGVNSPEVRKWQGNIELKLSEMAASRVSAACEFVGRIHMGQVGEVYQLLVWERSIKHIDGMHHAKDILDRVVSPLITGMYANASWGISSPNVAERARIAMDLHQVIRNRIAWERNPKGNPMHVHFDSPMKLAKETPMATIEVLSLESPAQRTLRTEKPGIKR